MNQKLKTIVREIYEECGETADECNKDIARWDDEDKHIEKLLNQTCPCGLQAHPANLCHVCDKAFCCPRHLRDHCEKCHGLKVV